MPSTTLYLGVTMATSISTDALGIIHSLPGMENCPILYRWSVELVKHPVKSSTSTRQAFLKSTEESTLLPLGATTEWNAINSTVEETPWVAKWKR